MRMALAMQEKFTSLRTAWKTRGCDRDPGIGIVQDYATLGAIGFEGRWDYACIGSVSNLAARPGGGLGDEGNRGTRVRIALVSGPSPRETL